MRGGDTTIRRALTVLLALTLWGLGPATVGAEAPAWLLPDSALLPGLRAGPRDPVTQGQLVWDTETTTDFGTGVAGEVSAAHRAAVVRLAGSDSTDAVVAGIEGAAFARFAFQVVTRELVNTDWVFAAPVVWRRGPHWYRVRYFHTSSHLGDEYQRRFGPSSVNFSRDGVDATARLRLAAGVGVYGLVFRSVNSHPEERGLWELRTGVEADPRAGALWRPAVSADVHLEEGTDWDPRWTLQAGVWLPPVNGRALRVALTAMAGPSPMGQFRNQDARSVGAGLFWDP